LKLGRRGLVALLLLRSILSSNTDLAEEPDCKPRLDESTVEEMLSPPVTAGSDNGGGGLMDV
jgi:hypothetical protein